MGWVFISVLRENVTPPLCDVLPFEINIENYVFHNEKNIEKNDLAINLKALNKGVQIDNCNISLLLYADDNALISSSEHDMQDMLNQVDSWCRK